MSQIITRGFLSAKLLIKGFFGRTSAAVYGDVALEAVAIDRPTVTVRADRPWIKARILK